MINRALSFLPAILFLLGWEYFVTGDKEREFLFASPSFIYKVGTEEITNPVFWSHVSTTLSEALLGFLIGSLAGIFFGLVLWSNSRLAEISRAYIVIFGSIPIFAITPMLIIWFGTGMLSKVMMAAFSVFFVTLAQVYEGAKAVNAEQQVLARSLGCNSFRLAQKVIIPGSLVWVLSALKMNVSLSLLGAFIGEFVSSEKGLGHYILQAGSLFDMPRALFGILVLSLLALILSSIISAIERRIG